MTESNHENIAKEKAIDEAPSVIDNKDPTSPSTGDSGNLGFWKKAGDWLDVPVKLLLMGTFVVAYFEYRSAVDARAVTVSFELVQNWENDGYQQAYRRIGARIDELKQNFVIEFPDRENDTTAERDFVAGKLIDLMNTDAGLKTDAIRVLYFYGKVGLCVGEEICNGQILTRFFGDSASSFKHYFLPYIRVQRVNGNKRFGDYAEKFANST